MFALAFALTGVLTVEDDTERDAFVELLRQMATTRGRAFDAPGAARHADALFPRDEPEPHARPDALAEAAAAFLGEPVAARVVVARFRGIAAGLVSERVRAVAGTEVFLERVASLRLPTALLCNGWSAVAQRKAATARYRGTVLVSEDLRAAKPEPAAFEALVAELALPADRIWFVGADPRRDVDGAAAAGMRAIWINPQGAAFPVGLRAPARTISALDELLPDVCEEYTRSLLDLRYVLHSTLAWRRGHFVPGVEYGLNDPAALTDALPHQGTGESGDGV
jgi:FMN phosphatase YigB (HAD superfamily)